MTSHRLLSFENQYRTRFARMAGVDEAGRGAWAGPVVAAAVIFEPSHFIDGIDDSKKLTPKKRDQLFDVILRECVSYGVGVIPHDVIDAINIWEATQKAMNAAIAALSPQPDFLLIDGAWRIKNPIEQVAIIDGDALSHSIAAASIVAKVTRDRLMAELSKTYPAYGFEKHKGYGTKIHRESLNANGCSPIHRRSYAPVAEVLKETTRKDVSG
jgi:ribonuclease HII